MPNSTTAIHPSGKLSITFTEEGHEYNDSYDRIYCSVTTLIHRNFPPFNAPAAAAAKSAKTGIPAEQYIADWQATANRATADGTRAHENCERQILGRFTEMHQPRDDAERLRFRAAWNAVEQLRAAYTRLEPEKLVFSPRFGLAGSIDCLAYAADGTFAIYDWKFIRELKTAAFGGRTGITYATQDIPDCNFYHYALQLNIYEQILKIEGYIDQSATVAKFLNVYDAGSHAFQTHQLPNMERTVFMLLAFKAAGDDNTQPPIPF